jgi:Glycosyltransferase family 87
MAEPAAICSREPSARDGPRLLGIFLAWRLRAYGGAIALLYVLLLGFGYRHGLWPVDGKGVPIFTDFSDTWAVGHAALHGHAARAYDPAAFVGLQKRLIGDHPVYMPHWPYPPTYFLILAPVGALPYALAFFAFEILTLFACIAVVCRIVPRQATVALLLAAPFSAWNFLAGQSGFLTASLVGAALLALERRPVLAGAFFGCLTYKPQFGILVPVALLAAGAWRAIASAVVTTAFLVAASIFFFGAAGWAAFPRELIAQAGFNLMAAPGSHWGLFHTAYGVTRWLGGGAALASAAQVLATSAAVAIVWCSWRAPLRHALRAAILSVGVLVATPYALAYDMAALAVTVAFLARDQIEHGLQRGEQTILLALFALSFAVVPTVGRAPIGFVMTITLSALILRRAAGSAPARQRGSSLRPAREAGEWPQPMSCVEAPKNFSETTPTLID